MIRFPYMSYQCFMMFFSPEFWAHPILVRGGLKMNKTSLSRQMIRLVIFSLKLNSSGNIIIYLQLRVGLQRWDTFQGYTRSNLQSLLTCLILMKLLNNGLKKCT